MAKQIKSATDLDFKVENDQQNVINVEYLYDQEVQLVKTNYQKAVEVENIFDRKEFRKGI